MGGRSHNSHSVGIAMVNKSSTKEHFLTMRRWRKALGVTSLIIASLLHFSLLSAHERDSIINCFEEILKKEKYTEKTCTTVRASKKRPAGAIKKKTYHASGYSCITAAKGYSFIGAPEVTERICRKGRCKHDPVEFKEDKNGNPQVCLGIHAWTESHLGGGPADAAFELCAINEKPFDYDSAKKIIRRCEQH